jgi:DNA polymerase I-like protein with 3'-5' exonuclease and polymerase domains
MMNVSKKEKLDNPFAVPARKCFRCRDGGIMMFVDYGAIEMRLMIERAKSKRMINILRQGGNIHEIAGHIFYPEIDLMEKPYTDEVYETCSYVNGFISKIESKLLYSSTKNGHFSLAYGGSPVQLGKTLHFIKPIIEGPLAYDRYAKEFPEIAYLLRNTASIAKEQGFVELPFGCRLYIQVSKAYRALNYVIQGTAALILKRAEIMLAKYFRENWDNEIRLVIPIHDELVIHFPRHLLKYRDQIMHEASALMVDIPEIKVPLIVEWKTSSSNWNNAITREIDLSIVRQLVNDGCSFIK